MSLRVVAPRWSTTAKLLARLIAEQGVPVEPDSENVVCYGVGVPAVTNSLNGRCGQYNKLEQLKALDRGGVATLSVFEGVPEDPLVYPLLGRKLHHKAGKDISIALQPEDASAYLKNGAADYFTRYIPRDSEFRVWVYRRKALAIYEKVLRHPERYRRVGANWDNGFAFQLRDDLALDSTAGTLAARAVDTLGLDFGAVDLIEGKDTEWAVLEVNTSPGVEDEGRVSIRRLARKIARWHELGMPKRRGAEERA